MERSGYLAAKLRDLQISAPMPLLDQNDDQLSLRSPLVSEKKEREQNRMRFEPHCSDTMLVELKLIREEAQNGNIFLLFSLMIQRLHYIVLKPGLYMYRIQSILNQH